MKAFRIQFFGRESIIGRWLAASCSTSLLVSGRDPAKAQVSSTAASCYHHYLVYLLILASRNCYIRVEHSTTLEVGEAASGECLDGLQQITKVSRRIPWGYFDILDEYYGLRTFRGPSGCGGGRACSQSSSRMKYPSRLLQETVLFTVWG